jgi:hypothetical protein
MGRREASINRVPIVTLADAWHPFSKDRKNGFRCLPIPSINARKLGETEAGLLTDILEDCVLCFSVC